jgi:hypothetical protein
LGIRRNRIGLLAFAHDGLAGEAARNTHANTQYPADGFRSHFDMMVAAADPKQTARVRRGCQLPDGCLRSKVKKSIAAPCAILRVGRRRR